ncbi:MAG: hypothetical protein JO191_07015 [Mycobacteriaceae bacterium]|nr:hypothetical protein [Mycobacteriaceae bacterium]
MRSAATVLGWIVATVALAVAVPAWWAERNLIDVNGYGALAFSAAHDPALQTAMASELSTQAVGFARKHGYAVPDGLVHAAATEYTAGPSFPDQFADANRIAHQWLFTDAARQSGGQWVIDVGPMLADTSIRQTLSNFGVQLPSSATVPVTADTAALRPGQLRPVATWAPWASAAAAGVTVLGALFTLAVARRRGRAVTALGVSVLLVGGGGWAAPEVCRPYLNSALNRTTGNVRTIADVMVTHAEASVHHWLNLTLAVGAALVVFGVMVSMLGALRGAPTRRFATGIQTSTRL